MAIMIDMEMPGNCYTDSCPCLNGESGYCQADKEHRFVYGDRPYWCPLRPAPGWISVEERLPEDFENVLVANKRGKHFDIDKGWWNGSYFDRCAKGGYHNVTHWMPLPSAPEVTR